MAQEAPELARRKKVKKGWWEQLWDGEEEEEVVIQTPPASSRLSWLDHLTPQERERLYNAVGYDENENIEHIPQVGGCSTGGSDWSVRGFIKVTVTSHLGGTSW